MSDVYEGRDVAPGGDWWRAADGKWYHPGLDPERQASETVPPADGWWRGVDDAWYPPELHPDAATATVPSAPAAPSASDTAPAVYPTADLLSVGSGSGDMVDVLPFVDPDGSSEISDDSPPAATLLSEPSKTRTAKPNEADQTELDPLKNPSPALSAPPMPAPPMSSAAAVSETQPAAASPKGTRALSPSLTPSDIAGPIFPTPTAAPAGPVSNGERMVLPSPGQAIDDAAVPAAGVPLHLPAPSADDTPHELPPPTTLTPPPGSALDAGGADLAPPPPVFSPDNVASTAPEFASEDHLDMNEFAASDSDHSMERLDEARPKRKLLMGMGAAALLAVGGLFLVNQLRGGSTDGVAPQAAAIANTGADVGDAAAQTTDVGAADSAQVLNRLRTTGIQGTDAEITTFSKGVCAEVESGSSWAEVLAFAANSELAITDPGMVAKVIASRCPGG